MSCCRIRLNQDAELTAELVDMRDASIMLLMSNYASEQLNPLIDRVRSVVEYTPGLTCLVTRNLDHPHTQVI